MPKIGQGMHFQLCCILASGDKWMMHIEMIVNNCRMQSGYLFTLELRVCRQIAKLNVYEEDSLNDLIARLSSTVTYKPKYAERLKEKLEAEFKKLVSTQDCSSKVRDKLQSLTEESKLIIVGISETEKNEPADETPFKILLENSANFRKRSVEQPKKQFIYEHESPALTRKYDVEAVPSYEERINPPKARQYLAESIKNTQFEPSVPYNAYEPYTASNVYNGIQEKRSIQDYSPIINITSKRSFKCSQNYDPRGLHAGEADRRREGCIRKHQAPTNYEDTRKDSFQDYKIQKIKSLSALGANQIRPKYESNPHEAFQALPHNKLVYNRNQDELKIDYSSKYLEGKPPMARERGGKKFSYLSQEHF